MSIVSIDLQAKVTALLAQRQAANIPEVPVPTGGFKSISVNSRRLVTPKLEALRFQKRDDLMKGVPEFESDPSFG
jgi:hypothetical protein